MKLDALIYDIEIIRAIPNRNGERQEGILYCDGWQDHKNMGISVIGCYDYTEQRYRVFCQDNFDKFIDATQGKVLVGFNSIPFDNAVINATMGLEMPENRCYDLLREIWKASGLPAQFSPKTHGGFGLDAMCETNFGTRKTGNGALAPVLWQQGKIGEVIDYCLNDIALTKQLFEKSLHGPLVSPKTGELLVLPLSHVISDELRVAVQS